MPAPHGRDLDSTRKALADWLRAKIPDATDLCVSELTAPGATGFSSDTLLFDVDWRKGGAAHHESLVARIEPTGHWVFPDYDLAKQFRVQSMLAETDVPVARMFWEEPGSAVLGAPFYLMERVEGQIPTDNPPYHVGGWLMEVRPEDRATLWWSGLDAMAKIHVLDWESRGFGFLAAPERGKTPLEQELSCYAEYLEWAQRGRPAPVCAPALAWLQSNRPKDEEPVALCWGDARLGNMIFREFRAVAVLDWEMVTLGNPVKDLAWWIFMDHHHSAGIESPRLPGFPARDETVSRWQELTGLRADHLDYYETYAALRFSVIMIRLAQQLIAYGLMPEDSTFEVDNIPSRLLARRLDLPPPGETAKTWP